MDGWIDGQTDERTEIQKFDMNMNVFSNEHRKSIRAANIADITRPI